MWTGQRHDVAIGLYHFPFRTYSPRLGRWLQRDPLGYVDGVNMYEYVRSMTMQVIDPLGLTVVGPCGEREDIDIDQLLKWLRNLKDAYKEWKDRKDPLGTFTEEDWQRIFGRFWRLILQHMNADTRQHFLDARSGFITVEPQ